MPLKRSLFEAVRSAKHNILHLRRMKMSYTADDVWRVRHDCGQMLTTTYPFLSCYDNEGYLKNGAWSLNPGDTVLDAGGCYGEFTLYASQAVGPSGRVLMMEPDEANLRIARRNFDINGSPSNITIVPAGLWNERTTLRFAAGQEGQSSVINAASSPGDNVIEIAAMTLSDVVNEYGLTRLDFVKMDIEGAELEALSVLNHLPATMRPRFAIASYHRRDDEPTAPRCEAMLKAIGYHVETGNPRHLTTWASR